MGVLDKYRVNPDGSVGVQQTPTAPLGDTPEQQTAYDQLFNVSETSVMNMKINENKGLPQGSLDDYQSNRLNALGAAITSENLLGVSANWLHDKFSILGSHNDPNFDPTQFSKIYDRIDPQFWDEVNQAQSMEQLDFLVDKYGKLTKDIQYLDGLGVEGTGYRVVSLLGDVPMISAVQKLNAAGKLGSVLQKLDKSYMGRALVAGTVEGTFEGIKQVISPEDRTELDLLMAIGLGGAMGGLYKPAVYSEEISDILKGAARDQAQDVAATGKLGIPERIRNTVENLQINVGSVFKQSPSPTMRQVGDTLFHDVLNPTTTFKATEAQSAVMDGIKSAFAQNFNPIMLEYMNTLYGKGVLGSRFAMQKQDEFYNVVGQLARGGDELRNTLPPELVAKMDAAIDKMGKDAFDILARNDHPLFKSGAVTKSDNWLPRRWNKAKLREDISMGVLKKSDFEKAVAAGMRSAFDNLGIKTTSDEVITEASKKFVSTLTRDQIQVGSKGFIMEDNALKSVMEEVRLAMGLTDEEVQYVMDAVETQKAKRGAKEGTAASTRRRADLDMSATYTNKDGVEIKLDDYVQNNVQTLWLDYGRTMGGDTALRAAGVNSRAELQQLRDKIVKELSNASGVVPPENMKYLNNFDAVVGDLLGMNSKLDPASAMWKGTRVANNLTRAAKLGATWFALAAETAQVTHRVGATNMLKSMPSLRQMAKKLRGKQADEVYDEIQTWEALGHEIHDMPSSARWDETYMGHSGSSRLDRLERFSDQASEAAFLAGGVKSGTAMLEHMFSVANRIKMVKMAQKQRLSKKDRWYFKQFGFDDATTDAIVDNIRRFGDKGNAAMLNLDQWDEGLGHKWSMGVRRQSHILVQRGNIGDQVGRMSVSGTLAKDTILGSLAMNLRNYMLVAWNKQLSRGVVNLTRGGNDMMDTFSNWTVQTAVLSASYMAKQYANYANDKEKLKEALQPERIAAGTFGMTTFSSMLPSMIDLPAAAITGKPMFSGGARGNEINPLGATGNYLFKELPNAAVTVGGLVSPYNDVSKYQIQQTLGMLPLSSNVFIKQATNELAEILKEK